ncbi:pancreatic lipase-related protein 2-like [Mantella aurantiaca]
MLYDMPFSVWMKELVNTQTIKKSNFNTSVKTRFIIHGYLDNGNSDWLKKMCQAMLQVEDVNCICVDWQGGSKTLYWRAAANIHVVGAEVANFIQTLKAIFNYPRSKIHLIGHSLGAHAAGIAGSRTPGIGRITGLDPAEPCFRTAPINRRLDKSDARLVDVIHTDASSFDKNIGMSGYGMFEPLGHLDFYPNGGKKMPGCWMNEGNRHQLMSARIMAAATMVLALSLSAGDRLSEAGERVTTETPAPKEHGLVACNHRRAHQYYTESIGNPDGFLAYKACSYDAFQKGAGFPCHSGGCSLMGHSAEKYPNITDKTQLFYLNTEAQKMFSSWRYKVTVNIVGNPGVYGSFSVLFEGSKGTTKFHEIYKGNIEQGRRYTNFIDAEIDAGFIIKVTFVWYSHNWRTSEKLLGASSVNVESGKDGKVYSFCGKTAKNNNTNQILEPCK